MRFVLVTPPIFSPVAPAAAPSVLTGYLRGAGHDAINFDVSRFCLDYLLTNGSVEASLTRIPQHRRDRLVEGYLVGLGDSVAALASTDSYLSIQNYRRHRMVVEQAMAVHATAFASTWTSAFFNGNHDREDPESLFNAVADGHSELLDEPIDAALPLLLASRPGVVGISVSFPQQMYGALRVAYALRKAEYRGHIVLGGAVVTRLRDAFQRLPRVFDFVDSIVLREGEVALEILGTVLDRGEDPARFVPDILVRRDGVVLRSQVDYKAPTLTEQPFPVFDDLANGRRLAPHALLPVSTTRNCYFDRCTFCAIGRSFNTKFRQMSPDRLVAQMEHLASSTSGRVLFKDVSEALTPRTVLDSSDRLAASGGHAWEAYLRFEKPFDSAHAARRLARGGLRIAYLGLESGSQRIVDAMSKCISVTAAESTIRHFADAGIWVHLFVIAGFFGESEADHEKTLRFIERNRSFIGSIQVAPFGLERDSDAVGLAARYGFTLKAPSPTSLSLGLDFEPGADSPNAEITARRVTEIQELAYTGSGLLPDSYHMWDAHKLFFADRLASSRPSEVAPAQLLGPSFSMDITQREVRS